MAEIAHLTGVSGCPLSSPTKFSHSVDKSSLSSLRFHIHNNRGGRCKCFHVRGGRREAVAMVLSIAASFGSGLEEDVNKTVSENSVVVYSKTWCPYSAEVKSLFKRLGVKLHVVELNQLGSQGPQLQKVLERLTGQHTVPSVFIGGKHIGGCTDTIKLHRKGELVSLLLEAGAMDTQS